MENSRIARERADAAIAGPPEQPTKGSAIGMIAAENLAVQEKSARLKKARLERDAAEAKLASKTKAGKVASPKSSASAAKPKKQAKTGTRSKGVKPSAAA